MDRKIWKISAWGGDFDLIFVFDVKTLLLSTHLVWHIQVHRGRIASGDSNDVTMRHCSHIDPE